MPELFPKSRALIAQVIDEEILKEFAPARDEPNIVRMLDVSTAHLPYGDRADLVGGQVHGQTATTEFGGMVNTAMWDARVSAAVPEEAGMDLGSIMRHALSCRCQYVLFDRDAPELPGFPTFEE